MLKFKRRARPVAARCVWVYTALVQPLERTLYTGKCYRTRCPVEFRFGKAKFIVPQGYAFDGPSIPRCLWWIGGLSPLDDVNVIPSLIHDFLTDNADELPRAMADAAFLCALRCVIWNGNTRKAPWLRRVAMYAAVRAWSLLRHCDK